MTKFAYAAPSTGTGTITLRAPETANNVDLELPLVGSHLASAQADGMPLGTGGDPVVESGSNTDGEWTRFADGTQIVGNKIPSASSGYVWNFPTPFIDDGIGPNFCSVNIAGGAIKYSSHSNVTPVKMDAFMYDTAASPTSSTIHVGAHGRWK